MSTNQVRKAAQISDDGKHRFYLVRAWNDKIPLVAFIMLNPSTADARVDDPTIRKCMGFARRWGAGGIFVVNLFTFRATDPEELRDHPAAELNSLFADEHIRLAASRCSQVVVGWGANADRYPDRVRKVYSLLVEKIDSDNIVHLGLTKSGQPRHPLYIRYDTVPQAFTPPWSS